MVAYRKHVGLRCCVEKHWMKQLNRNMAPKDTKNLYTKTYICTSSQSIKVTAKTSISFATAIMRPKQHKNGASELWNLYSSSISLVEYRKHVFIDRSRVDKESTTENYRQRMQESIGKWEIRPPVKLSPLKISRDDVGEVTRHADLSTNLRRQLHFRC